MNLFFNIWCLGMSYPPIRIDAAAAGDASDSHYDVHDEEDEGQKHAEYHDGESGACADQPKKGKMIVPFNDVDQLHGGEDPPGVPKISTTLALE
jgi:hypothetical protein